MRIFCCRSLARCILYINLLEAVKRSETVKPRNEKKKFLDKVTTKFLEDILSNKYLAHLKQDFK